MTTRPIVDWCHSTLEYLIGMSTLVDEAGLAGLPEQRLAFFITSYYKQIQFLTLSTL